MNSVKSFACLVNFPTSQRYLCSVFSCDEQAMYDVLTSLKTATHAYVSTQNSINKWKTTFSREHLYSASAQNSIRERKSTLTREHLLSLCTTVVPWAQGCHKPDVPYSVVTPQHLPSHQVAIWDSEGGDSGWYLVLLTTTVSCLSLTLWPT